METTRLSKFEAHIQAARDFVECAEVTYQQYGSNVLGETNEETTKFRAEAIQELNLAEAEIKRREEECTGDRNAENDVVVFRILLKGARSYIETKFRRIDTLIEGVKRGYQNASDQAAGKVLGT